MEKRSLAKKIAMLALAICLCFIAFAFVACDKDGGENNPDGGDPNEQPIVQKYAITCVDCSADATTAEKGATVTLTPATKVGKTFTGYTSSVDGVEFDDNKFVMPESDITVTAQFSDNKYTVVWKNADGTVLETDENVTYGATPTYDGTAPAKASTVQYDYTFDGWTPAVSTVSDNAEYTATFTETLRKYDVVWKNHDGMELKTEKVEYGATPEYDGETPQKASTAQYEYEFSGWSPAVSAVDENGAEYTAQFEETTRKYSITFVNSDGTSVLQTVDVEYGTVPTYDKLNLSGTEITWDPVPAAVSGEATYRAESTVTLYDGKILADKEAADTYVVDGAIENDIAFRYFEGKSDKAVFSADITVSGVSMPENISVGITATDGTVLDGTFDGANNKSAPLGTMTSTQFYINKSGIATSMNNISWVIRNSESSSDPDYSAGGGNIYSVDENKHNLTVAVYNNVFYFYIDDVFVTSRAINHSNISRNDGATHQYANGSEFMFGIAARETFGAKIVFDNIQGLYGDDALAKIKADYKYSIITEGENMTTAKDKTFNVQGANWNSERYAFTSPDTFAKSAVYSIKVKVGTKGDVTSLVRTDKADRWQILGLKIQNSSKDHFVMIGLSDVGVTGVQDSNYGMSRRYDGDGKWDLGLSTANPNYALTADNLERTFTVVLYGDKLYIYVDGTLIRGPLAMVVAGGNNGYFSCFTTADDSYRFGLFNVYIDDGANTVSTQILTEKYGNEAIAEIQANYPDVQIVA